MARLARNNKKMQKKLQQVVAEMKRQNVAYKSALEAQNKKIVELDQRIDSQNEVKQSSCYIRLFNRISVLIVTDYWPTKSAGCGAGRKAG